MPKSVNTILSIIIIALMGMLLIYGYCATQKLDEKKEAKVVSTITKHINYREENPGDAEPIELNDNSSAEDEDFEAFVEAEDDDFSPEIIEETIVEKAPEPSPEPVIATSPDVPFLVIAGSFQNKENAETKVNQYKKMGIDAEIVHLHNSKLHAICIARSKTEVEANDTMSVMKSRHKIKAYVYKKP